jgi:V/A-type H+-transporting ATPase subunit D
MSQVKLTKNELRLQQLKLKQLTQYLPTLQLKKAMLQQEVNLILQEIAEAQAIFENEKDRVYPTAEMLTENGMRQFYESLQIKELVTRQENIAGLDVPIFEDVQFVDVAYAGAQIPLWWDFALEDFKRVISLKEKLQVLHMKRKLLEKELREVSIRVNLFEKVLIPRTMAHIKKIKIFLGDLQLSAVCQAKVAKAKIESKIKPLEAVRDYTS